MLRPARKRTRKKYNTLNGREPKSQSRFVRNKCELCHRYESSMVCEVCKKHMCSGCSTVYMGDVEDIDTYLVICTDCASKPDLFDEYDILLYDDVLEEF